MKTILHVGAHRTATTTFQSYMRRHGETLREQGLGYWGPYRTRKGLFSGILPGTSPGYVRDASKRARGRVQLQLAQAEARGMHTLLISDENMIGTVRKSVAARRLYPEAGERMARFAAAFDGRIDRIVVSVRGQDAWWRSAVAFAVTRGMPVLSRHARGRIAQEMRGWRDVVLDIACAVPEGTDIRVVPFESYAGQADALLRLATDIPGPVMDEMEWLNRAPSVTEMQNILRLRRVDATLNEDETGRWQPFSGAEQAALRELYEDDMFWLRAGADGLATLTEDPQRISHKKAMAWGMEERGHSYVAKEGPMAQSG